MTTVLIANRGEIARRVIRTARRLGMRAVAVYADVDARLPHVRDADQAIAIGPPDAYLRPERIVSAAREAGAELVHPGYGFLSEDPALARAVSDAGLAFVGPPAEVLALCGSKAQAKASARRAGLPVLPGYAEEDQRESAFAEAARLIGYPLMVKPIAGGGGIGMVAVESAAELIGAIGRARRAARAAFGDERLMLEKLVRAPRHIEVQILADKHERVRALGERDCSAQRRHQKIVEEAPAAQLTRWQRDKLAEWATAMAHAVGYVGAGTVEFVMDERGEMHFLELNARLQVEHTVTEAVLGLDLVEQQLLVALGQRLSLHRATVRGHAIEARVYAEDPRTRFLPSTGRLLHVRWPDGVRVDAGYEEGDVVSGHFDPLMAKVVAHAEDRTRALDALAAALERTEILGVRTNVAFLRSYLAHPAVRAGQVTTSFVERELERLLPSEEAPAEAYALAAAAVLEERPRGGRDPWIALGAWRAGIGQAANVVLRDGERERAVAIEGAGPYVAEGLHVAREPREAHAWSVNAQPAAAARDGAVVWTAWRGATHELRTDPREHTLGDTAAEAIAAPMPGVVLALHAASGQRVKRGEAVAVIEAMKMELRIDAPSDGVVKALLVRVGEQVKRGQRLAEFEPG